MQNEKEILREMPTPWFSEASGVWEKREISRENGESHSVNRENSRDFGESHSSNTESVTDLTILRLFLSFKKSRYVMKHHHNFQDKIFPAKT